MFQWLLHTDAGLLMRITLGCAVFISLAGIDLHRHRSAAQKWREYSMLLAAVLTALAYGVINDQCTVSISREYFIFGKEIYRTLGEDPPMLQLRWEAAKVGLKATWSVGLIFGVLLLLANNPWRSFPRLRNRQLLIYLPLILIIAGTCGIAGGWLGYQGYLNHMDSDFQSMLDANIFRPHRFICCWGVHLGGYVGGLIGAIASVCSIVYRRMRLIE